MSPGPDLTASLLAHGLLLVVAPLWLLTGWLDSACHRALRIEHDTGTTESLLHLLMLLQLSVGVLAALFLAPNALAFLLIYLSAVVHEGTMWLDLAHASSRRRVPWFEQLVHSVQHALPWTAIAGLVLLHPAQALAVFGLGAEVADWQLRFRQPPLPMGYLLAFGAAALFGVAGPFVAEFLRCRRAAPPEGLARPH